MLPLAADTISTALIAGVAAVLASAVTLIGVVVTSRSKLAELQFAHRQTLTDAHFSAAREHADDIYVPLSAAVGALTDALLELRSEVRELDQEDFAAALAHFTAASDRFVRDVRGLVAGGRDAYLTSDLDSLVRDFLAFLTASKNADRPRVKVIIKMPGMSFQGEEVMSSGLLRFFRATRDLRMVRMLGLGVVTMKTGEVVAAPPGSLEFEDRFQRDVAAIREGIRDVTLGADRPRVD